MFGRSLALLQQTEVILTQDLHGVDLHKLRQETAAGTSMSDATAQVWTDVLLAVSPTLFDLGRELLRVHRFMDRRRDSMKVMQQIIWTLEAILIVMLVMSIGHVLQGSDKRDSSGSAVSVGIIIALGFFMFGAMGSWLAVVNEMYRKLRFQQNSPLNSVLLRFSDRTSSTFIVVFVAAATTGRDVRQSIAAFMKERANRDSIASQWSNCKKGVSKSAASCDFSGMDACTLAPYYSTPELTAKIRANCRATLVDIADALIDVADNGTSRYVRLDLWSAIDKGVQAVRKLVLTRYDDIELSAEQPAYSPDMIATIAREELAPCLKLPGVQLSLAFNALSESTVKSSGMAALSGQVIDPSRMEGPDGEALCFRSCMDSKDCKVAYFYKGGTSNAGSSTAPSACYVGTDYFALGLKGPLEFTGVGSGNASVYVASGPSDTTKLQLCGPGASKVLSDGHAPSDPADQAYVVTRPLPNKQCIESTSAGLYTSSVIAASLSSTMLDQMTYLANRVLAVLRRHRFALSLDDLRPEVDAALEAFYGHEAYVSAISSAVDAVLKRADDHARSERRNPRATIDTERLLRKLEAMPSQDAGDLQRTLEEMRNASVQHRNMFPAYRNASTNRIANSWLLLGSMTLVVFFAVFACILSNMYRRPKSLGGPAIKMGKLVQWMIIGLCVLVLTLFVFQTVSTKIIAKSNHNTDMIDQNGETLVGTSESVTRSLASLWVLLGRSGSVQTHSLSYSQVDTARLGTSASKRAASAALISQATLLISTYDKCNAVTTGQVSAPAPYAELLMYAVVAGLFVVVTGVSLYHIAPGEKLDNIRMLNNLIKRVKKGDVAAIRESESAVQCARPPAFIWSIFVWYGVMLLAVVTVWFVMESQNVVNDYEDSLAARTDCA